MESIPESATTQAQRSEGNPTQSQVGNKETAQPSNTNSDINESSPSTLHPGTPGDPATPLPKTETPGTQSAPTSASTPSQGPTPIQPYYSFYPVAVPVPGFAPPVLPSAEDPLVSATSANSFGYNDASTLSDPIPDTRRNRGGVAEPFPDKLHKMLEQTEREGLADVVSFFSHGRAFAIHKPKTFVEDIMPRFFKQSKLTSFQRQLNLYGFRRISQGPDSGGYYHELFLKGRPGLSVNLKRIKVKGALKLKRDPESEPNFYSYPPISASTDSRTPSATGTPGQSKSSLPPIAAAYPSYAYPQPQVGAFSMIPSVAPYAAAQQPGAQTPFYPYSPYYGFPGLFPGQPGRSMEATPDGAGGNETEDATSPKAATATAIESV